MSLSDTILDAEYEGTRFPVSSLQVQSGNASAQHKAYRRAGADIEDCGREPYSGSLTVPCIDVDALNARYGLGWPDLYRTLDELFKYTPTGRLVHPTLGPLTVHIDSWPHQADTADLSGVTLTVQWTEHDATISRLFDVATDAVEPTDSTNAVQSKADEADASAKSVGVAGWKDLGDTFTEQLVLLGSGELVFGDVAGVVRTLAGLVRGNLALPGMDAVASASLALDLEALLAQVYAVGEQAQGSREAPQLYTCPATMAAWQVAGAVYGDISKDGLITAANAITDPNAIPAGTVLTILPAP